LLSGGAAAGVGQEPGLSFGRVFGQFGEGAVDDGVGRVEGW
jgi:hypothetical protein